MVIDLAERGKVEVSGGQQSSLARPVVKAGPLWAEAKPTSLN